MSILILNRSAMSYSAYHEWLPERSLHYYTAPGRRDLAPAQQALADAHYASIKEFEDYDTSDALELAVLKQHEQQAFTAIVAMSEWDQIRAGRLRARLGLAGTTEQQALYYRDKWLMKQTLSEQGVPVTPFSAISNVIEVLRFVEQVGYPIVVKPRLLAASMGLTVLQDEQQLREFAQSGFGPSMEAQKHLLAEQWVDFDTEYHVDGLIENGELKVIWPSRYIGDVSVYDDGESLFGGVLLSPDDPIRKPLQALIEQTLSALPPLSTTTFHAEVFRTRDGQLLVNEIAARTGGFRINDLLKASFGVWLNREWAKAMAGGSGDFPIGHNLTRHPERLSGYLMLRPKQGTIVAIPQTCPLDDIYDYRTAASVGDHFNATDSSGEHVASVVVTGDDSHAVMARLQAVHQWFYSNLVVENK
ncbi:ATP-grasp domain-containing protein [Vibrio sp. Isolate22]|uniref:ATP-grasp domain-containing protein n=1 Tax=Vibrio sp. Isolate22 TaxID=2908532 RepID=UPI001EFD4488|nr:ATP-grasp domain-containing protein [Vibrio sp. Isolate22]MCG9692031.1 ATP-grasp domain-containing protein [Vibrio sp. Isolate22]